MLSDNHLAGFGSQGLSTVDRPDALSDALFVYILTT